MRDAELIEAMDQISRVGGVAVVHAENGDIVAEVIIIDIEYLFIIVQIIINIRMIIIISCIAAIGHRRHHLFA